MFRPKISAFVRDEAFIKEEDKRNLENFNEKQWSGYVLGMENPPSNIPQPLTVRSYNTDLPDCIVLSRGQQQLLEYVEVVCNNCQSTLQTSKYTEGVVYVWFFCPVCRQTGRHKLIDLKRILSTNIARS